MAPAVDWDAVSVPFSCVRLRGSTQRSLTDMAGADTTIALVQHIIFAMIVNPSIQRKAQEEIDRVIGPDRLPNLSELSTSYI